MRLTPKTYAELLYRLVVSLKNDREIETAVSHFVDFLAFRNDLSRNSSFFLRKVLALFEELYCVREGVRRVFVEFGSDFFDQKELVEGLAVLLKKDHQALLFGAKENSRLIAGVRVTYDQSLMIDASLGGRLEALL